MLVKLFIVSKFLGAALLSLLLLSNSVWQPIRPEDGIRPFSRAYEFDYVSWSAQATFNKLAMASLGLDFFFDQNQPVEIIRAYFDLQKEKEEKEAAIASIFADPAVTDPLAESAGLQDELRSIQAHLLRQSWLAEAVIQEQISLTLAEMGLTRLELPFPPVLFHVSDLPNQLVISPRDSIRQAASISLQADITLETINQMEKQVENHTDFSALVVSIGGVGTYPTMVIRTNNLSDLIETVAHEWVHNFLTLRPLGLRYDVTPQLRTMNETTASIAGQEISQAVFRKFYLQQPEPTPDGNIFKVSHNAGNSVELTQAHLDFRQEMYQTRLRVDELLAQGKIEEAETYMESRRLFFWENGYQIRKLNQAYFAFHGAYADQPFSAAGEDPVGSAVRQLRARSRSLADFVNQMAWLTSYDDLSLLVHSF